MKYTVRMDCLYLWEDKNFEVWFIQDVLIPDELSESHDKDCLDVDVEKIIEQELLDAMLEQFDFTYKVLSIKED